MSGLNPQRTIDELNQLRTLTGNEDGAQRVAWGNIWLNARQWYLTKLQELPVEVHRDEAGNLWATLAGESEQELLIGGHLDSVPNGGWLDGCLNVLAGLEVLRRIASEGKPPVTIRLVDWADEEGARFGRSLLGSSACGGTMDPQVERNRTDKDGIRMEDALRRCGIEIDQMAQSHKELAKAAAYVELHIEQGPVLESMGLPLGVVLGTCGVERHNFKFIGTTAHAGSTPMTQRRDALGAAAKLALEIREIGKRHNGVCTVGSVVTKPGLVTAIVGECDSTLDQRHIDAGHLAAMWQEAQDAAARFAAEENVEMSWSTIWNIQPIPFHPQLLDLCEAAIIETVGVSHRLPSGPLHDAAEVARAGIPTVMMFVQSLRGISHNKIEDTQLEHIAQSVVALDKLASKTIEWIQRK